VLLRIEEGFQNRRMALHSWPFDTDVAGVLEPAYSKIRSDAKDARVMLSDLM
jgi:hypothetical protein